MNNDLTGRLDESVGDKVDRLIIAVQSIDSRLGDLSQIVGAVDQRVGDLEQKVSDLSQIVGAVDQRVGDLEQKVSAVDQRVGDLDQKVDQRLLNTQPMWETVQAQLIEFKEAQQTFSENQSLMREDLNTLREDVNKLRTDVAALSAFTEKGFRTIDRRMERQIGEFEKLHAYQRDLEDRFDKLEKLSGP